MTMLKLGTPLIKRWLILATLFLVKQPVQFAQQQTKKQEQITLVPVFVAVQPKNTTTLLQGHAQLAHMNAPPAGGQANINALVAFLGFSILMKATPALNGWGAETASELPLKNATMETLRIMTGVPLTVK